MREFFILLGIVAVMAVTSFSAFTYGNKKGSTEKQVAFCKILKHRYAGDVEQDFIDFQHCEGKPVEIPEFARLD